MAVKTTLQQLEEVQAAITEVMSAQEYEIDGSVQVRKAKLESLTQYEAILQARYNREQGRSGVLTRPNFSGTQVDDLN